MRDFAATVDYLPDVSNITQILCQVSAHPVATKPSGSCLSTLEQSDATTSEKYNSMTTSGPIKTHSATPCIITSTCTALYVLSKTNALTKTSYETIRNNAK